VISIVLVTYNSASVLDQCLRSLAGLPTETDVSEIVVVDNASSDDSVKIAEACGARVISNPTNQGFASAANQGVALTSGDTVLLLNPDTALVEGLDRLAGTLAGDAQAGAAAGLLVDSATGQPQQGFSARRLPNFASLGCEVLGMNRIWPGNPVNRKYRCLDLDLNQRQPIDQPAGACLLVKREVWKQLGGFDVRFYPLWFEDVDFCLRLAQWGWRIWLEPRCRLLHRGGHSLERIGFKERQLYWYRNLFYYTKKNMGSAAALGMRVLVCIGACARIAAALLSGRIGQIGAFRAVIKLALTPQTASHV
jgi:N-acetylglucosaminyl-diphospho-decaprenol L-rhamnosyltransferase